MIKFKSHKIWAFVSLTGLFATVIGYQNCSSMENGQANKPSIEELDVDQEKPVIVSNLASSGRTVVGGSYSMSVRASGDGTLTYKWYHNDILLNGEDEDSLPLEPVEQEDEGVYRVRVGLVREGFIDSRELNLTVEASGDTTCNGDQILVNNTCQDCPDGKRPNTDRTGCVDETTPVCTGRQYLNGNTCQNCPTGKRPNTDRTGCVDETTPVCTGRQHLNGNTCQDCPTGKRPNTDRTGCVDIITCDNPTKSNLKTTMEAQGFKNVKDDPCETGCHRMVDRTEKTYDVRPDCTSGTLVFYKSCNRKHTKSTLKAAMLADDDEFTKNTRDNPCVNSANGCLIRKIIGPTSEGAYYPVLGNTCRRVTITFYKHKTERRNFGMGDFNTVLVHGCSTTTRQTMMCE